MEAEKKVERELWEDFREAYLAEGTRSAPREVKTMGPTGEGLLSWSLRKRRRERGFDAGKGTSEREAAFECT